MCQASKYDFQGSIKINIEFLLCDKIIVTKALWTYSSMISDDTYRRILITKGNALSRAKKLYNREGFWALLRISFSFLKEICLVTIPDNIWCLRHKIFKSSETFEFQGENYHYFFHPYCTTWRNERTVAVPILWNFVKRYEAKGKNILEIGNMLSYYFKVSHDILDKYEIVEGVINEDVVDYKSSKKYDLIISVLTLPEVGWYESPRDPTKTIRALKHLKTLLSPGGVIAVVMGLGINPEFDISLQNKTIEFEKQGYLRRLGGYRWQESKWEEVKNLKYDKSVPTATAVMAGTIHQN